MSARCAHIVDEIARYKFRAGKKRRKKKKEATRRETLMMHAREGRTDESDLGDHSNLEVIARVEVVVTSSFTLPDDL